MAVTEEILQTSLSKKQVQAARRKKHVLFTVQVYIKPHQQYIPRLFLAVDATTSIKTLEEGSHSEVWL